ncbi:hypothetical protein C8R44DRAFT_867151 [Mycena epipterygia]|nr:hypothetical protein C8R44DRAFT_867151 [Mycena epipterygia]
MILEVEWHREHPLSILGVYAPNPPDENGKFWKDIKEFFIKNPGVRKPEAMGGDMNVVEDDIDQLPAHTDPDATVSELDSLKSYLGLADGWRDTYLTTKAYTYYQKSTGSQSRLDRIYVKHRLLEQTYEWTI